MGRPQIKTHASCILLHPRLVCRRWAQSWPRCGLSSRRSAMCWKLETQELRAQQPDLEAAQDEALSSCPTTPRLHCASDRPARPHRLLHARSLVPSMAIDLPFPTLHRSSSSQALAAQGEGSAWKVLTASLIHLQAGEEPPWETEAAAATEASGTGAGKVMTTG